MTTRMTTELSNELLDNSDPQSFRAVPVPQLRLIEDPSIGKNDCHWHTVLGPRNGKIRASVSFVHVQETVAILTRYSPAQRSEG
jgi:hypothetical protein